MNSSLGPVWSQPVPPKVTDPVEFLKQWCLARERFIENSKHQFDVEETRVWYRREARIVAGYWRMLNKYRNEQQWGNIDLQMHATGGNKEIARQAASRAMYTADGLFEAIQTIADALSHGDRDE